MIVALFFWAPIKKGLVFVNSLSEYITNMVSLGTSSNFSAYGLKFCLPTPETSKIIKGVLPNISIYMQVFINCAGVVVSGFNSILSIELSEAVECFFCILNKLFLEADVFSPWSK